MSKTEIPSIRFRGFDNDWEQRKAKELFVSTADKGYPELPVLSATQDRGMIRRDENSINIFHDKKNEAGYKRVLPGQFVIHLRSFQGGFAHSTIEGITSPAYTVFGFSEPEKHDSEYWKYVFTSESFIQRLETVTYGIRDGRSISYEEFLTLGFVYPSKAEQTAIARYLDKLSDLITLHQRKFEKLTNVKKSMLEKVFPQNGSSYPEIRFKGFTDPWEQRRVLSCIQKITDFRGRTPKKLGMDWSESGYLALSALNVKDGYIDFSQDVHYGDQALYDKWMSGNELHKGQVLFTTEAPMGNVAQVPDNRQYILSQRTIAFDVREGIITENFLATLLRSPAVFNTLTSLSSGGTAKGVSQKSLTGVEVRIPVDLREQALLATYFHNLDNLITLHQRELEKLQNIKKSLLEKMFV